MGWHYGLKVFFFFLFVCFKSIWKRCQLGIIVLLLLFFKFQQITMLVTQYESNTIQCPFLELNPNVAGFFSALVKEMADSCLTLSCMVIEAG